MSEPIRSGKSESKDLRIVVIGGGMSGILCGIKLQEAGLSNFTIYEKAERLGGTWRDNRYPGLACDVPSHLYSYSFELNPGWTHVFSPGAEIQTYLERTARKYGVEPFVQLGKEVTRCELVDGRWRLETQDGQRDAADIVISATGFLHHPHIPDLEGLDSFAGATFHSARWDPGVPLDGRRIGVIGTGSTAIQITSALVDQVAKLSLFQRTAQWVMPQQNPAYTEEEKQRFRDDPQALQDMYAFLSERFSVFSYAVVDASSEGMKMIEAASRRNLEESVRDPELKKKLTPSYRAACKRLIISESFYEAIQQPNAELVTEAIERIENAGVRTADGRLHELDVLVLATGFNAHQFMRPMKLVGRSGLTLDEAWATSNRAYRSTSIPGFPNFFMVVGPNAPVGNFSLIEVAELQVAYILKLIQRIRSGECRWIQAHEDATTRFNEALLDATKSTIWATGCRSWYLGADGIPATWPWDFDRFRKEMSEPDLADFELS